MNWDYILSVTPRFVHATLMTLHLAFWGILLSQVIGVICAVITTYKVKSLTWLVKGYIELSRNTPLLIQVFFLYFGLSKIGLKLDGFTCGIIGLAFLGGSYMAEAFRGGLEAVSKGQIESALSWSNPFSSFSLCDFPASLCDCHTCNRSKLLVLNERNLSDQCRCRSRTDVCSERSHRARLQNQ